MNRLVAGQSGWCDQRLLVTSDVPETWVPVGTYLLPGRDTQRVTSSWCLLAACGPEKKKKQDGILVHDIESMGPAVKYQTSFFRP